MSEQHRTRYDDGGDDEFKPTMEQILATGWFVEAYAAEPPENAARQRIAKAMQDLENEYDSDVQVFNLSTEEVTQLILKQDIVTESLVKATESMFSEFKTYYQSLQNAFSVMHFNGNSSNDKFQTAYDRSVCVGKYWSMNLDFYRGCSYSRKIPSAHNLRYSLDTLLQKFSRKTDVAGALALFKDDTLFACLFPPVAQSGRIRLEDIRRGVHPLLPHEAFLIRKDPVAVKRVIAVVSECAQCFGLALDDSNNTFVQLEEARDVNAAWAYMMHTKRFMNRLISILTFILALDRRSLAVQLVIGLCSIDGWARIFKVDVRDLIEPMFSDEEAARIDRWLDESRESTQDYLYEDTR